MTQNSEDEYFKTAHKMLRKELPNFYHKMSKSRIDGFIVWAARTRVYIFENQDGFEDCYTKTLDAFRGFYLGQSMYTKKPHLLLNIFNGES